MSVPLLISSTSSKVPRTVDCEPVAGIDGHRRRRAGCRSRWPHFDVAPAATGFAFCGKRESVPVPANGSRKSEANPSAMRAAPHVCGHGEIRVVIVRQTGTRHLTVPHRRYGEKDPRTVGARNAGSGRLWRLQEGCGARAPGRCVPARGFNVPSLGSRHLATLGRPRAGTPNETQSGKFCVKTGVFDPALADLSRRRSFGDISVSTRTDLDGRRQLCFGHPSDIKVGLDEAPSGDLCNNMKLLR